MTIAWVLGKHGLLGSALSHTLHASGTVLFAPGEQLHWMDNSAIRQQIRSAVKDFAQRADAHSRWEIYWAAGIGTMSSAAAALEPETHALSELLDALSSQSNLDLSAGALAFASSAGAIYAGSAEEIISESTPPAPTTPYALEKLKQEELLRSFAATTSIGRLCIARFSTLYGIGQGMGKKQGLLTHLARSMIRRKPIQIFVPYDTVRDYITADDAAAEMAATLRMRGLPQVATKIVASEQAVSIAQIVSIFKRVMRQTPRVATSASPASALYTRCIKFKSTLPVASQRDRTSLVVGIAQLIAAERRLFAKG